MSGSVNVEMEDVLSSIRRLVSSEERPKAGPATPDARPRAAGAGRLVLTPSLRVDDKAVGGGAHSGPEFSDPEFKHTERPDAPRAKPRAVAGEVAQTRHATADQSALKARVAELEEVVARQGDAWDPDGAPGDANSGSPVDPLPWEDDAAPAGADEGRAASAREKTAWNLRAYAVSQEVSPDEARDSKEVLTASDDPLDEDALRDLVAEIVRQELQGALGERITRNVRKLVRREIQRALASQDLQ